MTKKILFQLHWLLGITAGVVVAIVGVTGALLSFEDAIIEALNHGVVTVQEQTTPRLSMPALLAKIQADAPHKKVMSINVYAAPISAARVTFAAEPTVEKNSSQAQTSAKSQSPQRRRGEVRYVDPYSGELLGGKELRGQPTLQTIERIHRGMVAGPTGRLVVGIATIALVVLSLSGLYLRWPRSDVLRWRTWLKIHGALKGRAFLWNLHSVIGTCAMLIYLIASLTGLYFAFDWYRQGLIAAVGATPPNREAPKLAVPISAENDSTENGAATVDMQRVWSAFEQTSGGYESAVVTLPPSRQHAVEIRYLGHDATHERAQDRMILHPLSGEILKHERFVDKTAANKFIGGLFPLHSGGYFGVIGKIVVMIASISMPLFAITGWMLYLQRRRSKQLIKATANEGSSVQNNGAVADSI